ncbi:MAG: universal stress protein [Zavarzinella sp.]
MGRIIACIDGSEFADHVCTLSAWASERSGLPIVLLHVVAPHTEVVHADMSGQIGLGANASLLEVLTKADEEHGKQELTRGLLMLEHAKEVLAAKGMPPPEVLHRRGSLVETIAELEAEAELIVMGKRGEHLQHVPHHMGANLERVDRAIHKPLLVATPTVGNVQKFLIAYDGSPAAEKAIDFAARNPLLKGLECYLLKVSEPTPEAQTILSAAMEKLTTSGVTVHASIKQGKHVDAVVAETIAANQIDLLVMGAYGHSKIRSMILGSTTSALIRTSEVPVLLFR